MHRDFSIYCGEKTKPGNGPDKEINLNLWGGDEDENVVLRIEDIDERLLRKIPSQLHDLVEIAVYVYCADQLIRRTNQDVDSFGGAWRRNFTFHVPVRELKVWKRPEVIECLSGLLGFLSDDRFTFKFVQAANPPAFQTYLKFDENPQNSAPPEQVILFSGGLDSLGGAVDEVIRQRRKVVLVTHKPTTKNNTILRKLHDALSQEAGDRLAPIHLGVRASKRNSRAREYTQRTRSFLFACFGATIAKMLGLNSIRFYENGVVSLNLPICAQVIGSRATRTTHPRVIEGFQELFTLLSDEQFTVENPFLWKTKADVIRLIVEAGIPEVITTSVSCTHVRVRRLELTHCGTCSQCIDRRIAIVAADAEEYDPATHYKHDIFLGERPKDDDKILSAAYLERAHEIEQVDSVVQFIDKYPELLRAVACLPGDRQGSAERLFELHKRHAREVRKAVDILLARHAGDIRTRKLPGDSLLRIVYESGFVTSLPAVGTDEEPPNFFYKRGNVWQIRFNKGKPLLIQKHRKGCEYLQFLLGRPDRSFSVYDVAAELNIGFCEDVEAGQIDAEEIAEGFSITDRAQLGDLGDVVDKKALAKYRERLGEIPEERREAETNNDVGRVTELEEEVAVIEKEIGRAVGLGGRIRKARDERKNLRDSVRNSVNRTIEEIGKDDRVFADHLRDAIDLGAVLRYQPEVPTSWSTRPRSPNPVKNS